MNWHWRDQSASLAARLPEFRAEQLSFDPRTKFPETALRGHASATRHDLRECDLRFLFCYDVFPPAILKFFGEWQLEDREMRVGDTIVQQAQIPPARGIHLVFGVRVVNVERTAEHAGFSYGTLREHPETGTNAFSFAHVERGIDAVIRTAAVPALWLSRSLAHVFTNRYVTWCNRQAFARMTAQFQEMNA